jgi:hypothetical protein
MIVLGPLIVAQYVLWSHRCGMERTTCRYLAEEPLVRRRPSITTVAVFNSHDSQFLRG